MRLLLFFLICFCTTSFAMEQPSNTKAKRIDGQSASAEIAREIAHLQSQLEEILPIVLKVRLANSNKKAKPKINL